VATLETGGPAQGKRCGEAVRGSGAGKRCGEWRTGRRCYFDELSELALEGFDDDESDDDDSDFDEPEPFEAAVEESDFEPDDSAPDELSDFSRFAAFELPRLSFL
jgi:hypothetical protein